MDTENKKNDIVFMSTIAIVLVLIIIAIILLITKNNNNELKCMIYSSNSMATEGIDLHIYARGNNAAIKEVDGLVKNNDYYNYHITENGTYTFYVTDGKNENSCSIEVKNINKLTGIIKSSTNSQTTSLILTIVPDKTNELANEPYSWDGKTWSAKNTLKVTKNGAYTGYIKDKYNNIVTIKYEVRNIVSSIKGTGIAISSGNYNIEVGKTLTLKTTISPSNANDYKITWATSNSKIVTVNSNGKITGVSAGTAVITATLDNGASASCNVNVVAKQASTPTSTSTPSTPITPSQNYIQSKYAKLNYILYYPSNLNLNKKNALVIFLHGVGECGTNIDAMFNKNTAFVNNMKSGKFKGAVYLAPQCARCVDPNSYYWRTCLDDLKGLIDEVVSKYNIDPKRISITGHSIGGQATYEALSKYPDLFSVGVVLAGWLIGSEKTENLAKNKIVVYCGTADTSAKHCASGARSLKNAGVNLTLNELEGEGHLIQSRVYDGTDIIAWMIKQTR